MRTPCELSVIIPTCPNRQAKLRRLLEGIARTPLDRDSVEVIVVVDGEDDAPLADGQTLLESAIPFVGLTQPQSGPATARNRAIKEASGKWTLFFNDDARIDETTIPLHLQRIRATPDAAVAHLGRFDWLVELIDSPWRVLLAETSMIFFWNRMREDERYGFRHFWTNNLSVRTDLLRDVGGFDEQFPDAVHEDIELGWRLAQRSGLAVVASPQIPSWHDHAITVSEYLHREHRAGRSAAIAASINRPFFDEVWPWVGNAEQTLGALEKSLATCAKGVRHMLDAWSVPSSRRPSASELEAAYLAHIPLKRIAFCRGFLGQALSDEPQESELLVSTC